MIKTINEFNNNAQEESQFLNKITQIFYHSRRLLNAVVAPKIIDIFIENKEGIKEKSYVTLNYERIYDEKSKNISQENPEIIGQSYKFTIGSKIYCCEFLKKNKGVFFCSLIEIRESNNILSRYFLRDIIDIWLLMY